MPADIDIANSERFSLFVAFTPGSTDTSFIVFQIDDGTRDERYSIAVHNTDHHLGWHVYTGGEDIVTHDPRPPFVVLEGELNRVLVIVDRPGERVGVSLNGSEVRWSFLPVAEWPGLLTTLRIGSGLGGLVMPGTVDSYDFNEGLPDPASVPGLTGTGLSTISGQDAIADNLTGTPGRDYIAGDSAYDARFFGRDAADTMAGGAGDDRYWVNHNADRVIETAGQGHDIIYSEVSLTLSASTHVEEIRVDRTEQIEIEGNGFAQLLSGGSGRNTLCGAGGNDTLDGSLGDDVLLGGAGNDTIVGNRGTDDMTGGPGADRFVFASRLDLGIGAARDVVRDFEAGTDILDFSALTNVSIAHIDIGTTRIYSFDFGANGSIDGELEVRNGASASQAGGNGIDTLTGGAGKDSIDGKAGNDAIDGAGGDDTLIGGAGDDALSGGAGDDLALGRGGADELLGGNGDDLLAGGDGTDDLRGGDGGDTLAGGVGDDLLIGGTGADRLDGGAYSSSDLLALFALVAGGTVSPRNELDTASYRTAAARVIVDLASPGANTSDAQGDVHVSIERFELSNFDDVFRGGDGADDVAGLAGNDTLLGRDGDDTLEGGPGQDILNGGAGTDFASYASAGSAISIDLLNLAAATGEAANDTFQSVEGFRLGNFADTFFGSSAANVVDGGAGNDALHGRDGADLLAGGIGSDTLDGGAGADTASYGTSKSGVTVDLSNLSNNTGDAAGDTFVSIESFLLTGSSDNFTGGNGNDRVSGLGGDDFLSGGGGDDRLTGGGGPNDRLTKGGGSDTLDGGAGNDAADYSGAAAALGIDLGDPALGTGEGAGDTFVSIEVFILSGHVDRFTGSAVRETVYGRDGGDTISGAGGNDSLLGENGDDAIDGGTGNDTLTGGAGADGFAFTDGWGIDRIADFDDGADIIDLSAVAGISGLGDLAISQSGADALVVFGAHSIRLTGFAAAGLSAADFIF